VSLAPSVTPQRSPAGTDGGGGGEGGGVCPRPYSSEVPATMHAATQGHWHCGNIAAVCKLRPGLGGCSQKHWMQHMCCKGVHVYLTQVKLAGRMLFLCWSGCAGCTGCAQKTVAASGAWPMTPGPLQWCQTQLVHAAMLTTV
jgi:hypothetical protein